MSTKKSSILEDIIFKLRPVLLIGFVLLTGFFAFQASKVQLSTEFQKMVPLKHEFIQNLLKHIDELSLGNDIRIAIEVVDEDAPVRVRLMESDRPTAPSSTGPIASSSRDASDGASGNMPTAPCPTLRHFSEPASRRPSRPPSASGGCASRVSSCA